MNKQWRIGMALVIAFVVSVPLYALYPFYGFLFRDHSPAHVLKTADVVYVQPRVPAIINGKSSEMNGTAIADLDARNDPQMLALLHQSSQFHSSPSKLKPDFTIRVLSYGGQNWIYEPQPIFHYISRAGEIGTGATWWYVPPTFKAWLLTEKAKMPQQKPIHITHIPGPGAGVIVVN